MKTSRFSEQQIAVILKQVDAGYSVEAVPGREMKSDRHFVPDLTVRSVRIMAFVPSFAF